MKWFNLLLRKMTDDEFSTKELQEKMKLSDEKIEEMLKEFEDLGVVFKTWDIRKQDYVWHKTEIGHEVAKRLGME